MCFSCLPHNLETYRVFIFKNNPYSTLKMFFFTLRSLSTFVSSKTTDMNTNTTFSCRMKKILTGALLMVALVNAKAQYVTIPDTAFVSWLQNNGFAGCMSGNQLDTSCNAV